jgi:hypothetical protein
LDLTGTNKSRVIVLETDGGENFSATPWGGPAATTFPSGSTLDFSLPDLGYAPAGSWETNALRRFTRLLSHPASTGGLTQNSANDALVIGLGPVKGTPLGGTDVVPPGMTWRVDILFSLCGTSNTPALAPCPGTTSASRVTPSPLKMAVLKSGKMSGPVRSPFQQAAFIVPSSTLSPVPFIQAQSTTTTGTPTKTIAADELEFFTQLGHATSKSSFRTIVRDPTVKFGTKHKLAGDVDDSGCVDGADFNEVTQSGVYFQRAVQPNQLAIRCDLNADGWVNRQDAAIVLANWGKGCINPVGPKPVIP